MSGKNNIRAGTRVLSLVTGAIGYLILFFIFDPHYLTIGSPEFIGDLFVFLICIVLFSFNLWAWWWIYKAFNRDRTRIGFSSGTNGILLTIELIIEILIVIFFIYVSETNFLGLKEWLPEFIGFI